MINVVFKIFKLILKSQMGKVWKRKLLRIAFILYTEVTAVGIGLWIIGFYDGIFTGIKNVVTDEMLHLSLVDISIVEDTWVFTQVTFSFCYCKGHSLLYTHK